jgi:hypothetical protein
VINTKNQRLESFPKENKRNVPKHIADRTFYIPRRRKGMTATLTEMRDTR